MPPRGAAQAQRVKEAVRQFWSRTRCGSWDATAPEGTREYYDQIERRRYELEPFIHGYAEVGSTADQEVLEVGVGLGPDHVQFARAGAHLPGGDLTQPGVDLVRQRLDLSGLSPRPPGAAAAHPSFPP